MVMKGAGERQTLTEEGKLREGRAIRVAHQICDALKYLHGQGVVHRDLKLENTMVDGEERIKILNCGTASKVDRIRVRSGKSHAMGIRRTTYGTRSCHGLGSETAR